MIIKGPWVGGEAHKAKAFYRFIMWGVYNYMK